MALVFNKVEYCDILKKERKGSFFHVSLLLSVSFWDEPSKLMTAQLFFKQRSRQFKKEDEEDEEKEKHL